MVNIGRAYDVANMYSWLVSVTSATLEEGKQAGCEDKRSGSLNTCNRSFITIHHLKIPSFFLSSKTRKKPVKSLPFFGTKSKLSRIE